MLAETAVKYYHMGYNCAESIIRAGNEVYGLDLHDRDMIMTAAFGGGFQIGAMWKQKHTTAPFFVR